jgi:hypothetical protein
MRKIIIGFSKSKSPLKFGSLVIQEVEKRHFSHVYVRYTDEMTGIEIVAQASQGFVHEVNYDIFKEHNTIAEEYQLYCNGVQYEKIIHFIKTNLGEKYSYFQLFMIGLKKILHIEIPTRFTKKQYICSEFAAFVCKIAQTEIPQNLNYITPSDLREIILKLPARNCKRIL